MQAIMEFSQKLTAILIWNGVALLIFDGLIFLL
jgi:hypothetical protein